MDDCHTAIAASEKKVLSSLTSGVHAQKPGLPSGCPQHAAMILAKLPSSPTSFGKSFPVRLLRRNGVPGEPSGSAPPSRSRLFL
jgi:hypothetical protein